MENYVNRLTAKVGVRLLKTLALNFYLTARVVNAKIAKQRLIVCDAQIAEIRRGRSRSAESASLVEIRIVPRIAACLTVVEKSIDAAAAALEKSVDAGINAKIIGSVRAGRRVA